MTSIIIALGIILALALMIWGVVNAAKRDSAAKASLNELARERAQTIKALTTREEIEDAVNADPELVKRAARFVRPDTE